jgi:hypothetical protein
MQALDWVFLAMCVACVAGAVVLSIRFRPTTDHLEARRRRLGALSMLGAGTQFALLVLDRTFDGGPGGILTVLHLAAVGATFVVLWRWTRVNTGSARPASGSA